MATSRATTTTLRTLTKSLPKTQIRSLHMTGPATFPSPLLTTQKPSFQKVQAAISDAAASQTDSQTHNASTAPARKFNTSRSLKAVRDTSTIDFAYLPELEPDEGVGGAAVLRVPLLPESLYPRSGKSSYSKTEAEVEVETVMLPEINLMSADSTHITPPAAFSDVHDNNAVEFHGVTEGMEKIGEVVEQEAGGFKRVWDGFLDDIMGAAIKKA
ncbi:hypothetical protein EJ08DRAFT_653770 [Tothia fuscella]|uniref:Uncharacterized protein n=1 Tax=Tothia fuscella TaxID=1048955 RepID=A0A9P4TT65_9PEZI|nr:hypothetical protein EJ08DRAFT_653770 [Tothia fuscella]